MIYDNYDIISLKKIFNYSNSIILIEFLENYFNWRMSLFLYLKLKYN
jgi:hypothetical protein